jgi:hypothetical protein
MSFRLKQAVESLSESRVIKLLQQVSRYESLSKLDQGEILTRWKDTHLDNEFVKMYAKAGIKPGRAIFLLFLHKRMGWAGDVALNRISASALHFLCKISAGERVCNEAVTRARNGQTLDIGDVQKIWNKFHPKKKFAGRMKTKSKSMTSHIHADPKLMQALIELDLNNKEIRKLLLLAAQNKRNQRICINVIRATGHSAQSQVTLFRGLKEIAKAS